MTQQTKKVLILGDRGQLGSALLLSSSRPVMANNCKPTMQLLRGSDYNLDISDHKACELILNRLQPDVVVNAAAYTEVDAAEKAQAKAFSINADAIGSIAAWCNRQQCYLIHISTDYVFSGKKPLYQPYVEGDATGPLSIYGASKLQGELQIQDAMPRGYAIFRTAWLYGFSGNNFLKAMLKLNHIDATKAYKVVADQFGSPTSTIALSEQIFYLIDQNFAAKQSDTVLLDALSGIFHATSSGYCSWYQLACEFLELMGCEHQLQACTTQEYPTAATRPQNSILENHRLELDGNNCFIGWQQDLSRFVGQYRTALLAELH